MDQLQLPWSPGPRLGRRLHQRGGSVALLQRFPHGALGALGPRAVRRLPRLLLGTGHQGRGTGAVRGGHQGRSPGVGSFRASNPQELSEVIQFDSGHEVSCTFLGGAFIPRGLIMFGDS